MNVNHWLTTTTAFLGLMAANDLVLAQAWMPTSAPVMDWRAVASSADGSRLLAVSSYGPIHISTNSGSTWTTPTNAPFTSYLVSAASSADGTTLAATVYDWVHNNGAVLVSTNSGDTWAYIGLLALAVASSADGSKLVAAGTGSYMSPGLLSLSRDSGVTWIPASAPVTYWSCVASSADGTRLFAGASRLGGPFWPAVAGPLYASTNSGLTWSPTSLPDSVWASVVLSADGTRFAAVGSGSILTSTNAGVTWTSNNLPSLNWNAVATSADGSKLVATAAVSFPAFGGVIYHSTNAGATWWDMGAPDTNWTSVAASVDGGKLVATVNGGVYVAQSTPSPTLNIARSSNHSVITWIVPSSEFVLQQNADLTSPNWTDVTKAPILDLTNLQHGITLPVAGSNRFYRLRH